MSNQKDNWDKTDILAKVALPIIILVATLVYNNQLNYRQQSAAMVEIAVGVVSEAPSDDSQTNALRDWAIDKLTVCLLYTSPSPRDKRQSRMPSSA